MASADVIKIRSGSAFRKTENPRHNDKDQQRIEPGSKQSSHHENLAWALSFVDNSHDTNRRLIYPFHLCHERTLQWLLEPV